MKLINACKFYNKNKKRIVALNNINVEFKKGNFYAIMGKSGAGKSTLIQVLGLLDDLTSGNYYIDNKKIENLSENEKADIRRKKIGFIFQSFHLNENLMAYENVVLPMLINENIDKGQYFSRSLSLLKLFDLENRIEHFPKELSGGEKQRVAIARALANDPEIILADEPTGNLDKENEEYIFEILKKISRQNKIVIVVSHNENIKKYADFIYQLDNGSIVVKYEK